MPMRRMCWVVATGLLLAATCLGQDAGRQEAKNKTRLLLALRAERTSPLDLELGGELAGVPAGATRYLTRDDLLSLPRSTFTVKNDSNFSGLVEISGIALEELLQQLGAAPDSQMIVAICDDLYHANYSRAYIAVHHPLLALMIDGQPPSGWPKDAEGHGQEMGPYLISHREFVPSHEISALGDEPQIPWGVVRLEFRNERKVMAAIAPRGRHANDESVEDGYLIARENCFRCHNSGAEGGTKAGHPWMVLSAWATAAPEYFSAYVRNPQSKNPHAQMPGNPGYNDKFIRALTAYFQTLSSSPERRRPPKKP